MNVHVKKGHSIPKMNPKNFPGITDGVTGKVLKLFTEVPIEAEKLIKINQVRVTYLTS